MAHLTKYEVLELLNSLSELVRKHGHEFFPESSQEKTPPSEQKSTEKGTEAKPTGGDGKLRGTPTKYQDEWAVRIDKQENPEPKVGDTVEVTSSGGKTWEAVVTEILPDYPDNYLVRAPGKDKGKGGGGGRGRGGGGGRSQTSKPASEQDSQALTDEDDVPF